MAGLKSDLERFERVMRYVSDGGDTGNAYRDALDKVFLVEDGADFDMALLTLDLPKLHKYLLLWRRNLILEIDEEIEASGNFYYIGNKPKEVDL